VFYTLTFYSKSIGALTLQNLWQDAVRLQQQEAARKAVAEQEAAAKGMEICACERESILVCIFRHAYI
jgi:hypothetical protein